LLLVPKLQLGNEGKYATGRFNMLEIHKSIVVDENHKPIAVQIPIKEFERMEEVIENYGLAKLMDEVADDEPLSVQEAKHFYGSLKRDVES
jgi:hypothetical protein